MGESDNQVAAWTSPRLEEFFAPVGEVLARPLTLVCLMAALNALIQPYVFDHDAQLYAAQVIGRLHPGTLDQDLYLLYGSQDRFTLFSPLIGQLVSLVGLDAGFFLGYLVSKLFLMWGMVRLVSALVEDPTARVIGLLYLALAPLPFGGHQIISINECFLTPRIMACALVLFALERMLADRLLTSILFLIGALLFHPLMAAGGVVVFAGWVVYRFLGTRTLVGCVVLAAVASAVVLLYEPLGTQVFGHMDEEWRSFSALTNYYIIPDTWPLEDWWRIGWAVVVAVVTAVVSPGRLRAFLGIVLTVAAAGLLASEIGMHSHYLLLIQASPYRALWLLEFLIIPLSISFAVTWWRRGTPGARSLALGILFFLPANPYSIPLSLPVLAAVFFLPLAVLYRGLGDKPRDPQWLWRCTGYTFLAAVALMLIYDIGITLYHLGLSFHPTEERGLHPLLVFTASPRVWYRLPVLLVSLHLARRACAWAETVRFRGALLGSWAAYQAILFFVPRTEAYSRAFPTGQEHLRFVKSFLESRAGPEHRMFTVYWQRDLVTIWYGVGARCYFTGLFQLGGSSFNRQTTIEGKRRLEVARSFEIETLQAKGRPYSEWVRMYFAETGDLPASGPPTVDDLRKLCADPAVDFAILENRFDGLYCATDGHLYIYDCRKIRESAP